MDELQLHSADFSALWATWDEEKRCQFLYPADGGINELRRLMKWVAQSDTQLHEAAAIYLEPQSDLIWLLQGHCQGHHDASTSPFYPTIPMGTRHSLRWQYFLASRFLPLPLLKMVQPPLFVQEFDNQIRKKWSVRITIPTSCERLEASKNLRVWVRDNDAPAELLALLEI